MSQSIIEQTQIASAHFYSQCTTLTSRSCESGQEALNCQMTGFEAMGYYWLQSWSTGFKVG